MVRDQPPAESIGQRIGRLRVSQGWTQADLAARLAASRVAVSHFEAGLAVPSERTIVLLAGLFKIEPTELVEGTNYPTAKRERLPAVACRHTEIALQVALLRRDLAWIARVPPAAVSAALTQEALDRVTQEIGKLREQSADPGDRALLQALGRELLLAMATFHTRHSPSLATPKVAPHPLA